MKNKNILFTTLIISFFFFAACQSSSSDESAGKEAIKVVEKTPQEHLKEIMRIWPGNYSNDKQIAEAEKAGKPVWRKDDSGEGGFLHVQSHYVKLDRPDIAENVLYVEEYRDKDVQTSYRQRIYTLDVDSSNTLRVKMWPFKDKKKYIGACNDLSMLDGLTKEEISAYPDKCDLLVKLEDGKYNMYMNGKDCAFGDRYFNYQVMLSEDVFSYRDKIMQLSNDSLLTTAADFAYHDLDRIQ